MPVIGTAGHVDHGKSTLVAALTGRDPDRWAEEKARGLTIDLGFAWTKLPGGPEVSFVDVPGHERFMKNMLAGIETIDVALFVVAADEGWMPQSEEHLAVLDLLEVTRGVVALTKVDRVEHDLTELAALEVEEKLEGTGLAGAPIVPVSARTSAGLEELSAVLARLALESEAAPGTRPRMWIDRSFVIEGAGTVVTGTLLGAPISVGDQVAVWPGELRARVRGIESHEQSLERVEPHRRVALNLAGVDRERLDRGAMLGMPGDWTVTGTIAVTVRRARFVDELTNRGAYHLHIGSGAWPIRLRMLADDVAVIDLPTPLPISMGDRFIIRDTGRRLVVAGGRVIDPAPGKPRQLVRPGPAGRVADRLGAVLDAPEDERAAVLLSVRGADSSRAITSHSGGGTPPDLVAIGSKWYDPREADRIARSIAESVGRYHDTYPLRAGLPAAEAVRGMGSDEAVAIASRHPDLMIDSGVIRARSFQGERSDEQQRAWNRARKALTEAGYEAVPRIAELELLPDLLHSLVRAGELVRVSSEFAYLPHQIASVTEVIRSFSEPFTVSEFKDRAGISRKYAVPLLEWADEAGITVRMGDKRRVRE
jgi:selenocysteine-specific elongation factor